MKNLKLFVVLLGGKPESRMIEQHDVFVGVAEEINELFHDMEVFWPGVDLHIDGYIALNFIDEYKFEFQPKTEIESASDGELKLYFINLGGYHSPDLEEYHKKLLIAAKTLPEAVSKAKEDSFYKEGQDKSADRSHVDDKEAIDDIICISDSLPNFRIALVKMPGDFVPYSDRRIGYLQFSKL